MEDGNAQLAAMQAQFEETIAKLREDLTARLQVQGAANKKLKERAETAGTTAAGTAGRAERLNVQGVSGDNSGVTLSFNSEYRRDGNDFPDGVVGQQHGSWNRHQPLQPQFAIHQQHNQQHLPRYQQRSLAHWQQRFRPPLRQRNNQQNYPRHQQHGSPHRRQRFRPPLQHPHQRGGSKSGPGGPWDCGQNATWYQEKSPVPSNAPMGSVPKCSRCGRIGHLASICGAPRRFEGNCAACGEYGHLRRFCITARRPIPMQPHANGVTVSCGGCGDSSWGHNDGGSKGVTWTDQQTGGMASGGHFFALLLRKASEARVNRRLRRYYLIVRLLPNVFALACLPLSSI